MDLLPIAAALLAACQTGDAPSAADGVERATVRCPGLRADDDWRTIAREEDRRRLRNWREAWVEALADARAGGHAAEIAAEGALLEPDSARPSLAPPPGDYACRTIKLGAGSPGMLPYVAYPAFRCRIRTDGAALTLVKLDGSQRPIGRLYTDTERRMVFLGTMQLGDERRAYQYGIDGERDLAGMLERVDDRRWRLVFPYPRHESLLDAIELIPAAEGR